ncbi:MAG: tetratricopeptide repeat protein [Cytophagales bacterium]|nr:tetratricopeptide repeat protein [Cytophagales bacterium]
MSTRHLVKRVIALILIAFSLSALSDDYDTVSRLIKAKQWPEALSKVEQFLSAKPLDPQLRFFKGIIQFETGKMNDATKTFLKLTEDYPEHPEPYNNLAVIYANSGQIDKARATLETALRTNPSYSTAYENLGDIYAKLASQSYSKALQIDGVSGSVTPSLKLEAIRDLLRSRNLPVDASPPTPTAQAQQPSTKTAAVPVTAEPKPPIAATTSTPAIHTPSTANAPSNVQPTAASPLSKRAIESSVENWAQAWSNRNMDAYFACYTKDFIPSSKQSHTAWQEERRQRIMGKAHISVKLSNITTTIDANGMMASVTFRQEYKADALAANSRKTLQLTKVGERWLIAKETTH